MGEISVQKESLKRTGTLQLMPLQPSSTASFIQVWWTTKSSQWTATSGNQQSNQMHEEHTLHSDSGSDIIQNFREKADSKELE